MLRRAVTAIRRFEVPLYVVTAVLGTYLAAANVLRGAKAPDEAFWGPWKVAFVAILVCAVYVPLYALYKALDAHYEKRDRSEVAAEQARARLVRDLEVACQRVVADIAEHCPEVEPNHLAASVWLCADDGSFDHAARFLLPYERKGSGTVWARGRGVAGMAWANDVDLRSDLRPLYECLDRLGDAAFDDLEPGERFGLSANEVRNTSDYSGICAIRLFGSEAGKVAAIFVVDYTGSDHFACVAEATREPRVKAWLGGCERRLSEYSKNL